MPMIGMGDPRMFRMVLCAASLSAAAIVACGTLNTDVDASLDAGGDAPPVSDVSVDAAIDVVPEGSVRCGASSVWCNPITQYCFQTGTSPALPFSKCSPLPGACADDRTCACLIDASVSVCGDCVLADSGLLVVGCFDP
jgi:hypothetical protein